MIRWLCAAVALSIATPSIAGQHVDREIGRWSVGGDDRTCSAATKLDDGTLLMVFAPPPGGENSGGLMFSSPKSPAVTAGHTIVRLSGAGSVVGDHEAIGYAETKGYWLPFGNVGEVDRYPDSWQLTASKDGATIVDGRVTDFKVMVAALKVCAAG